MYSPTHQLYLVTAFINENEDITTQDLLVHLLLYQSTQPIKRLSHIGGKTVEIISPVIVE
jgi:hypothetical protein